MREEFVLFLIMLGCFLTMFGLIGTGVYFGPIIIGFVLGFLPPEIAALSALVLGVLILGIVVIKEK